MKTEINWFGIKLIPETYQDGLYLAHFCKEADENQVTDNLDLEFHKEYNEKSAGGSCLWKEIDVFYWHLTDEERDKLKGEYLPIDTEDITSLTISPRGL